MEALFADDCEVEHGLPQGEQGFCAINGHTIIVGGLGDEALIEQIIQTLRVIEVEG